MISSEQSDFYIINRRKIISDAGSSSSEGSNETIFRLFSSQLWKSLPRFHEGKQLSNDFNWTKRIYIIKRRKIMSDAGNSSSEGRNETIFRVF